MSFHDQSDGRVKDNVLLGYCDLRNCQGLPIDVDYQVVEGEDCPVCYESLSLGKVRMIGGCLHSFCEKCFEECDKRTGCPMCRLEYRSSLSLSRKVICESNIQIALEDHRICLFSRCPTVIKYLENLNDEWKNFAYFILSTQSSEDYYEGIKGIQHLCFANFKKENRLLSEGKGHVVIKTAEGKTQVVIGCMLACMSVRLVISPKDDESIEADNEYADEAIGYMNRQLKICWRVFPRLLSRGFMEHILIRNFHDVTCSLLLIGNHDVGLDDYHFAPLKDQLGSLKECNFEKSCFDKIRHSFPPLDRENLLVESSYTEYDCCCKFFLENNNDDDIYFDSDSEDEVDEQQQDVTENDDNY